MNKPSALIGHTGFVGSMLARQGFDRNFNSSNIQQARGQSFSRVVCAGVQAVKWWANKNPVQDWAGIETLLQVLEHVEADEFILISTVDVFGIPVGVDETTPPVPAKDQAYGTHRRAVEKAVLDRFGKAVRILRLPGLFGPRLKKNLIFDILEKRDLSGFNPDAAFQFYDIGRLADDIETIRRHDLSLVHLATPPVRVAEIGSALGVDRDAFSQAGPRVSYDMRTISAGIWGKSGAYIEDRDENLERIGQFAQAWSQQ